MKRYCCASFFLLAVLLCLRPVSVSAQTTAEDSLLYKTAVSHLISLYHTSAGDQSGLFNGTQYGGYPFSFTDGHPFFMDTKADKGAVLYDGIWYENLLLQFDEVMEVVFMRDSSRRIQLLNQRLEQFTLFGNNFIRIVKDSSSTALVSSGFYNLLYDGSVSLLKREEKKIRDDVSTRELRHFIDQNEYYYLKKNNSYYSIRSKRGLLDLFMDKKTEVKQYIAKNKLSYRKDRQNMLTRVTAYYDQLIK